MKPQQLELNDRVRACHGERLDTQTDDASGYGLTQKTVNLRFT